MEKLNVLKNELTKLGVNLEKDLIEIESVGGPIESGLCKWDEIEGILEEEIRINEEYVSNGHEDMDAYIDTEVSEWSEYEVGLSFPENYDLLFRKG